MTAEMIALLLGVLVALYIHKPVVRFVYMTITILYLTSFKNHVYNYVLDLSLTRRGYSLFRTLVHVKPRSYTTYVSFIQSLQLDELIDNAKLIIREEYRSFAILLLITLLPALIMTGNFWYYLAGYVAVIVFVYMHALIVNGNSPRRVTPIVLITFFKYTWDDMHPPRKPTVTPEPEPEPKPDMSTVESIMKSSPVTARLRRYLHRSFFSSIAIYIVSSSVLGGLYLLNKPASPVTSFISSVLNILNTALLFILISIGIIYVLAIVFRVLQNYRPD